MSRESVFLRCVFSMKKIEIAENNNKTPKAMSVLIVNTVHATGRRMFLTTGMLAQPEVEAS